MEVCHFWDKKLWQENLFNRKMKFKKILITGGAGYVGTVLTEELIKKGYEVTVLDLMIYGEEVLKQDKNLKIIKGDIRDQSLLKKIMPKHEIVIHLACISNDPSFELNPSLGKSINLDSFLPLVEISKEFGVKRFIYASSSSVYGLKTEKNVHEQMTLEPLTDYSKYKMECERILLQFKSKDFTPIVIRPATVCGYSPRQRLDVVVNIFANLAFNNREIKVFGGDQLRPNIHIKDMVRAYISLLEASDEKVSGEIFNAGYENVSVLDLAKLTKNVLGNDIKLTKIPTDDNRSYHISSKKINEILKFIPKHTIKNAIEDLRNAFEKNLLPNSLKDEKYFNIKKMQKINLK